ncbi:MAG: MerR family transcriptional regulator [Candidatus Wallbacteria bacterium]|nr:MerR family transcriptional regulator [Candidatus Wallbacteria bacterium]
MSELTKRLKIKINDLCKGMNLKKRTIVFWVDEYELGRHLQHNQAGNSYSDRAIYLLLTIKELKESDLFTSKFIKLFIKILDKSLVLPELPSYLPDVTAKLMTLLQSYTEGHIRQHLIGCDSSAGKEEIDRILEHIRHLKKKLAHKSSPQEELLMEIAELYRLKLQNYTEALMYYLKLIESDSPKYKEVARIFYDILKDKV